MVNKKSNWLKLFQDFVSDIRIASKHVVSDDPRGAPLILWDGQKRYIKEVGEGLDKNIHVFNCLKSRQLGITTISLAIDVFWMAMHNNIIGCLVTDTEKNRDANRMLLELYVKSFPDGYFGDDFIIEKSNRQFMQFSNGARLDLLVAGVKKKPIAWSQGQGYTFAHLTEIGNYADGEGVASLEEGFAIDNEHSLYVFESTANGFNHWRTRWMDGVEDPHTQKSFFVGWWSGDTNRIERKDKRFSSYSYAAVAEERELIKNVLNLYGHKITPEQLAWIRWKETRAGQETDLLSQNQPWTHEQAFVLTGYNFFQSRMVAGDMNKILQDKTGTYVHKAYCYHVDGDFFNFSMEELEPRSENVERVELRVWAEPVEGGKYVIGFDPAYGRNDHKDHHSISVFRCFADKMVQVASYCTADVETKHAAWVLFHLCAAYGDTMANVELGGPGRLVMSEFDHLRQLVGAEMNRDKTAARGWEDAAAQARWFLYKKVDSPGPGYVANFETNWRTKQELMHSFRGAYVSQEIEICELALLREMNNVVVVDEKIGAPESTNEDHKDDRVFSTALANRAWQEWVRKDMLAQGLTYDVVMGMEDTDQKPVAKAVNQIIYRFLKTQAERDQMPEDTRPKWLVDRGLA